MKYLFYISVLISSSVFSSQWTPAPGSQVASINPGGGGGNSTFISLEGVTFSGCTKGHGAVISKDSNPDYDQIFSVALAAKMASLPLRIYYGGCVGNYPEIKEVAID